MYECWGISKCCLLVRWLSRAENARRQQLNTVLFNVMGRKSLPWLAMQKSSKLSASVCHYAGLLTPYALKVCSPGMPMLWGAGGRVDQQVNAVFAELQQNSLGLYSFDELVRLAARLSRYVRHTQDVDLDFRA